MVELERLANELRFVVLLGFKSHHLPWTGREITVWFFGHDSFNIWVDNVCDYSFDKLGLFLSNFKLDLFAGKAVPHQRFSAVFEGAKSLAAIDDFFEFELHLRYDSRLS